MDELICLFDDGITPEPGYGSPIRGPVAEWERPGYQKQNEPADANAASPDSSEERP